MVHCDRIRRILKMGDNMTPQQQQVAVEMMDLHVVRPVMEARLLANSSNSEPHVPARYCYVKLVAPVHAGASAAMACNGPQHQRKVSHLLLDHGRSTTEVRHRDGIPELSGAALRGNRPVLRAQNRTYAMEDVFVSKAVRSIQLKLRECLVIPPAERIQQRFSVCFPDRMCTLETPEESVEPEVVADPPRKRNNDGDGEPIAKRPEPEPEPTAEDNLDQCSQSTEVVPV